MGRGRHPPPRDHVGACGRSLGNLEEVASLDSEERADIQQDPANDVAPTSTPPGANGWYQPNVDTTWQWQPQGPLNTTYDLDLFDTPAQTIADLQADGIHVICYFSAGSGEDWRPGYSSIPNDALGRALAGFDGERWLDIPFLRCSP